MKFLHRLHPPHGKLRRAALSFAEQLAVDGLLEHVHRIEGVIASDPDGRAARAVNDGLPGCVPFDSARDLVFSGLHAERTVEFAAYDRSGQALLRHVESVRG